MKKQKMQTIILLVLLVICVLGYLITKKMPDEEETQVSSEKQTVTNVDKEKVIGLSYLCEGKIIELTKTENGWKAENDITLELEQETVETMLGYACNITTDTVIDEPEELANYGLSNPANTICLTLEDECVIQILIGDCMEMTGEYYVLLAGDPKVYTISEYIVTNFEKTLEELVAEVETTSEENLEEIIIEDASAEEEVPEE